MSTTNGNVTEILNTDATHFTFAQGTGGSNGWGPTTPTTPVPSSSATYQLSAVAGNIATIAWSGRALYLNPVIKSTYGPFTANLDGTALNTRYDTSRSLPFNYGGAAGLSYQNLLPVHRYNVGAMAPTGIPWVDGAHTTILTASQNTYQARSGNLNLGIDSAFMITGPKLVGKRGVAVMLGDSISDAYGAFSSDLAYTYRTAEWIAQQRREDVNYIQPGGIASSCLFSSNFSASAVTGGMYRLFSVAAANPPEFLIISYGANDLRTKMGGCSAADFARNTYSMLAFIEDVFDVSTMCVVVCSPFPMSALVLAESAQNVGAAVNPQGIHNYKAAIVAQKAAVAMFPWARYCDMNGGIGRRILAVYPNKEGDGGIHLSDVGHGLAHANLVNTISQPIVGIYNPVNATSMRF